MALIKVPRPKNAYNPDRPMGSLLKAQIEHLREAESKLPLRYRNEIDIYIKAIKTEGEAAAYIYRVTKAIHDAHADAELARRATTRKRAPRKQRVSSAKKRVSTKRRKK